MTRIIFSIKINLWPALYLYSVFKTKHKLICFTNSNSDCITGNNFIQDIMLNHPNQSICSNQLITIQCHFILLKCRITGSQNVKSTNKLPLASLSIAVIWRTMILFIWIDLDENKNLLANIASDSQIMAFFILSLHHQCHLNWYVFAIDSMILKLILLKKHKSQDQITSLKFSEDIFFANQLKSVKINIITTLFNFKLKSKCKSMLSVITYH